MAQQHINYSTPNSGNGDTLRTSQVKAESNFNELYANKVDKISGKGLSDTNYTQAEKDKLAGLTEGGQAQSDWNQGDNLEPDFIKNKPENVSEFFNDSEYVEDVGVVGLFVRSNGTWENLETALFPKIQFTADGVQTTFNLGTLALAKAVFWNGALLDDGDFSQTDNILTLTFTPVIGDKIKPI